MRSVHCACRRLTAAGAVLLAVMTFVPIAAADSLNATLLNVNDGQPYETVNLTVGGTSMTGAIAGLQHWQRISGAQLGTSNLIDTFCIEILQEVYLGGSYNFTLNPNLADAPTPGSGITAEPIGSGLGMGTTRADMIAALWGHSYSSMTDDAHRAAFQSAIWEIVYETQKSGGGLLLDTTSGNFSLQGSNPSNIVAYTQDYLNWTSANYLSAPKANLVALTSSDYQDQITVAAPLPRTALAGLVLMGGTGLMKLRRRRLRLAD